MFESALRNKYRYPSSKGDLTTEQLWDLPLTSRAGFDLDSVAKAINADLKQQSDESFVTPTNNARSNELSAKLDIVKHVISVKQAENLVASQAAARKQERERLTEILNIRNQEELMKLSPAEIQARIDALDGKAPAAPAADPQA